MTSDEDIVELFSHEYTTCLLYTSGLGYGMLVFPDMFLFRKIAAVFMAFSERNVIFACEIKSYLKA